MSSHEVDLSIDNALNQADITASHYLGKSIEILGKIDLNWEMKDAIALAHIMAIDFGTAVLSMKLQEIRDAITERSGE
jgi:hypothetical protein